jgi:hypothetical protein
LPRELKTLEDGCGVWKQKRKTVRDQQETKTIADQARIQAKNFAVRAFAIPDHLRTDAQAAAKVSFLITGPIYLMAPFLVQEILAAALLILTAVILRRFS